MTIYIRADHGIPFTPQFGQKNELQFGIPRVATKTTLIYAVHTVGLLKGAYGHLYGHVMNPSISFFYENGSELRLPDEVVRDLENDSAVYTAYRDTLALGLEWPHRDRPPTGKVEVFNIRRNPEAMEILFSVRDENGRWDHAEEYLDDAQTLDTGRTSLITKNHPAHHVRPIRKALRQFLAGKWTITPEQKAVNALAHGLMTPIAGGLPNCEPDAATWAAGTIMHQIVHRFGIDRNDAASMVDEIANIIDLANTVTGRAAARATVAAS